MIGLATIYRDEIYSLQILLSRTQAGQGRTVKQGQEEISPNHVQRFNLISIEPLTARYVSCVTTEWDWAQWLMYT